MSAILEKLTAAEQARESAAREAYVDLVQQLAHGTEDPSLTDVQAVLAAAGKSAQDLSDGVYYVQQRNELRDTVAKAEAGAIEKKRLLEEIEAAAAKLETAKRAHNEAVRPLCIRISEIDHLMVLAAAAKQELIAKCDDEVLLAREHSVRRSLDRLDNAIREQRGLVARIKSNLDRMIREDGERGESAATKQKRERFEAEAANLESMRAEQAALVEESNEIVEAKVNA